jgi:16S rRNA (adenine1518-N6/adenine1519-N6)-dimethyltransferase
LIHSKKSLGQHFLHEVDIARRIADAVGPSIRFATEVGPGHGMLTQFLIGRFERLLLIEKDRELAALCTQKFLNNPEVSVREADILTFDLLAFWENRQFLVIGNFPYNISSQIVFRVLELRDHVPEMIGMFQYEMARRIVAGPGTKDYGILSVLTSVMYESRILFKVSAGAFNPPPKVESAVVLLARKASIDLPCTLHSLRLVVKTAFGQRRKMLRNSLRGLFADQTILSEVLFQKRPEQLGVQEFIDIAMRYEQFRDSHK